MCIIHYAQRSLFAAAPTVREGDIERVRQNLGESGRARSLIFLCTNDVARQGLLQEEWWQTTRWTGGVFVRTNSIKIKCTRTESRNHFPLRHQWIEHILIFAYELFNAGTDGKFFGTHDTSYKSTICKYNIHILLFGGSLFDYARMDIL